MLSLLFLSGFFFIAQKTGGIFVQIALSAGGLTTASATGCCPERKREGGRSLPGPAAPKGPTLPASTRCLKWKCCSNSWQTVRKSRRQQTRFGRRYATLHYVCKSYRFRAGYGSVDWSLETGVSADCAVVRRLTSYSHTLAPVSAPSQPDRQSTVRQSRESGRKGYKFILSYLIDSDFLLLLRQT